MPSARHGRGGQQAWDACLYHTLPSHFRYTPPVAVTPTSRHFTIDTHVNRLVVSDRDQRVFVGAILA